MNDQNNTSDDPTLTGGVSIPQTSVTDPQTPSPYGEPVSQSLPMQPVDVPSAPQPINQPSNPLTEVGGGIPSSPFQRQESPVAPMPQVNPEINTGYGSFSGQQSTTVDSTPPPITPQAGSGPITANSSPKNFSKFRTFIIIAIIAIVAIYSFVTFLYFQNKKLKQDSDVPPVTEETTITEEEGNLPSVTPPVLVTADNVKILNGNIVLQSSPEALPTILVNKEDYSSTGITGFARVAVSGDGNTLCFESWPPAPEPALYISSSDGSDVKEVSPNRQNCLWARDNQTIFYSDYTSKTPAKNIYSYLISSGEEKNLTLLAQPDLKNRAFDIVGLSADGSKLICKYTEGKTTTGQCEIDLQSFEVTYPEE